MNIIIAAAIASGMCDFFTSITLLPLIFSILDIFGTYCQRVSLQPSNALQKRVLVFGHVMCRFSPPQMFPLGLTMISRVGTLMQLKFGVLHVDRNGI